LKNFDRSKWCGPEGTQLLEALVSQAAVAIERAQLEEKARQAQLLEKTAKLQSTLLNAISHNLRTPLASITGVLTSLMEDRSVLDQTTERELLETAKEESERLNRLVQNLLDTTRLEFGAVPIKVESCDIQDLIGTALAQLGESARKRQIAVEIPARLPLVPVDFVLITQVVVNLVDNAIKYSPHGTPIVIQALPHGDQLRVVVMDRGEGIPEAQLERVFDRFNRAGRAGSAGGIGLGLAICKGLVEAHKGQIWAERRSGGGTVVSFTLPLCARPIAHGAS
jgi:two-component system sensor histidine kinase KdpD